MFYMTTITIPKSEYLKLMHQAKAYQKIAENFASQIIEKPLVSVIENFRSTEKYKEEFLFDLEDGLKDLRKSKLWKSR